MLRSSFGSKKTRGWYPPGGGSSSSSSASLVHLLLCCVVLSACRREMTPGAARGLGPSSRNRETSACRFGSRDRRGAGGRRIDAAARLPPQPVALLQAVRAFRSARAVANGTRRRGDSVLRGDNGLRRAECFAAEGGLSFGNAAEQRLHTTRHGGHSSCPPRPHSISLSSRYTVHCEHRHRIAPSPSILDRGVPAMPSSSCALHQRHRAPGCASDSFGYGRNSSLRTTRCIRLRREQRDARGVTCERRDSSRGTAARVKGNPKSICHYNHDGSQSVLGVHGRAVTCQLAAEARPSPAALFSTNKSCGLPSRVKTADVAGPAIRPPR